MKDLHLEQITSHPVINYSNPTRNDWMGMTYKAIESCDEYSYGEFYGRHDKKPVRIYATMFEGKITPILTEQNARKAYRDKLNSILEEIRNQPIEELPF